MAEQSASNEEILSAFTSSADKMQALVQNLSEPDLDLVSETDGWSVRQIVHHVADDCDVWSLCIKKAIATPGVMVRFEGFPGNEAWAQGLAFEQREIGPAINLMTAHRQYIAHLLTHFPDVWEQSVKFGDAKGDIVGEMTVRGMVKMLIEHMLEHVEAVAAIIGGNSAGAG